MPSRESKRLLAGLAGLAVLVAAGAALLWALLPGEPPAGPAPVEWNRSTCAQCRMHIGEPGYAAQLRTAGGKVAMFDDPGCLFLFEDDHHPQVEARWFHHVDEDRWLAGDEVGFVPRSPTPMGYGLGAVSRDVPGALPLGDARRAFLQTRRPTTADATATPTETP